MCTPGAHGGQVEMESPHGFWGLNLGSVEEHQVLLLLSYPSMGNMF